MWTPKRILLLTVGGILFFAGFVCYASFLGGIDGLPPLPVAFLPDDRPPPEDWGPLVPPADVKLIKAFGDDCPEIGRVMRIELAQKGLVLSTNVAEPQKEDGRVRLSPFSVAVFKEKKDGSFPEINTIRCKEAYLRFDQPIHDPTEMGNHKIIGAELRGDIRATNNRGTPLKSDDLEARVPRGPVFFDDKESRIWTDDFVTLLDMQTQPEPTRINAKGMDLHLTKADPKDKPKGAASKGTTISGIDQIVLTSNVEMLLWVDSSSGFLSPGPEKKGAKAQPRPGVKAAPGQKSRVVITTEGPFTYDLPKDRARFESLPRGEGKAAGIVPGQVTVWREHVQGKFDQIICDLLVLQFRRKKGGPGANAGSSASGDREIESACATAKQGEEVKLAMDTENLEAHGSELTYYTATPTRNSLTILKGSPMWALKDAHKITALELHLTGANGKGEGQEGSAKGPGQIDLLDHNSGAKVHQYHALWKDMLVLTKDHEGERVFDLLTFTGKAVFIDDEHHQEMRGDKLQVWLEPPPREEAPLEAKDKKQAAAGAPRQRPHKVEAFDHVVVRSPDMNVRECDHLIIRFKDGPTVQLPEMLPRPADGSTAGPVARADEPKGTPAAPPTAGQQARPPAPAVAGKAGPPGPASDKQAKSEHKPIDVAARRVAAYVLRAGSKNEMQEVVAEGNVHVHQDGAKPEDKGIDIKGETLNLVRYPQGDVLVVFGDSREPGHLQLGELLLVGPKVTINQKDNTAEVEGAGAMQLPSNTGLDGGPAKKSSSRLTVYWTNDMLFNGKDADFHGGVVAYQDDASLRCNSMQVTLDRVVSFKEGQKSGQAAKMEKLVCDRKVYVADTTLDKNGDLLRYERLVAQQLTVDNQQGPTIAPGPGKVYLLQQGSPEDTPGGVAGGQAKPGGATPPKTGPQKQELTLTRVDYQGRLFSSTNPKDKTRITKFYDKVEVLHLPANNPDIKIDIDKMGKGGFYMKCERLTIFSKPMPDGKTGQYMRAEKNVSFQSQDMKGQAPLLKYSQPEELVIFEGDKTNPVVLYRFHPGRAEPERLTGTRILYNRRTGEFTGAAGEILTNSQ
jgi:hypothetical protein